MLYSKNGGWPSQFTPPDDTSIYLVNKYFGGHAKVPAPVGHVRSTDDAQFQVHRVHAYHAV